MTVTITQLNKYIKNILENDIHLANISVSGEISNFKLHSSGHCYLSLKDEQSAIRAVMFKSSADKLRFRPENGMKVVATGRVSVYERDGQYQLYITSLQPDGVGDLYVAYEQLKKRLEEEGLFSQARKKPIPRFPRRVGVVTSPTGAAVRDIMNIITRRYQLAEIILCPVLVQGENAAGQISNAIYYMNKNHLADVLIVGRGGGSIEDLWPFNEDVVAYAIADSEIPIISAVGHETDFTIADFAADLRAPTPSAAAELAVPSAAELKANIHQAYSRMLYALQKNIESKKAVLSRFAVKNPMDFVNQNRIRTDNDFKNLCSAMQTNFAGKKKALAVNAARLDALSPLAVLGRGYSVVQNHTGVVRSVKDVAVGEKLHITCSDGHIDCITEKIGG